MLHQPSISRARRTAFIVPVIIAMSGLFSPTPMRAAPTTSPVRSTAAAAAPTDLVPASLVQTISTSSWTPASPDPSGITYLGTTRNSFLVVDSEVDETTGAGYHDVNIWEVSKAGVVLKTGTTWQVAGAGGYTDEPTGIGFDPTTGTAFISSDDQREIFLVRQGSDGTFGTADDVHVGSVDTAVLGVDDAEDPDLALASGHLYILDGEHRAIVRIDPVDGTFGNGNDTVSTLDISGLGPNDFEALAYDPNRETVAVGGSNDRIYELTLNGTLVRTIDVEPIGISPDERLSGLAIAPSSTGSGTWNYWFVDRGVDNDDDATENDGRIIEIAVAPANTAPVVESVSIAPTAPKTNATLTATASGTDPDGDAVTFTYQWLKDGADIPGEVSSTLNLSETGNGDRGDDISVRVTATDGTDSSGPVTSAAVTVENSAPVFTTDLGTVAVQAGGTRSVAVAATDADGDSLAITLASGAPSWVSVDDAADGTASVNLEPEATQVPGSHAATLVVSDGTASDSDAFTASVTEGNTDPHLAGVADRIDFVGRSVSLQLAGTDDDGDDLTYSVTGLPNGLSMSSATGRVSGSLTAAGVFDVSFTASDGTASDSVSMRWFVSEAFTDIGASKFITDIRWLSAMDITHGCTSTRFCPDGRVTRSQMASFLSRALNLPATSTDFFDDDDSNKHEANINRMAAAGITVGCGGNNFCPNGLVTRGQMATFLARAFDLPATSTDFFDDDNSNKHEARINRVAAADITHGCSGERRYCPDGIVTRGQMAAFIRRAMD